jgi:hypothetical protein
MQICDDFCAEFASTWIEDLPVFSGVEEGLVSSWSGVAAWNGSAFELEGDPTVRAYPAATWFGDNQILVWGGQSAGANLSDLFVWDTALGERTYYAGSEPGGERVGASAVYDPVSKTAYLYGGAASDAVYGYALEALAADDNATRLEGTVAGGVHTPALTAHLSTTDAESWVVGGGFSSLVECDAGSPCWAEDLDIYVATEAAAEVGTLVVNVEYADLGDTYELVPYMAAPTLTGFTEMLVRLPRILTDGQAVEVVVEWLARPRGNGGFDTCSANLRSTNALCRYYLGADDASTAGDDRSQLVMTTAQPVTPASLGEETPFALTTTFTLPPGWQGVAPGAADTTGTTFAGLDNLLPAATTPFENYIVAVDGLVVYDTLATATGAVLPRQINS